MVKQPVTTGTPRPFFLWNTIFIIIICALFLNSYLIVVMPLFISLSKKVLLIWWNGSAGLDGLCELGVAAIGDQGRATHRVARGHHLAQLQTVPAQRTGSFFFRSVLPSSSTSALAARS
jgi:hypothetical protein